MASGSCDTPDAEWDTKHWCRLPRRTSTEVTRLMAVLTSDSAPLANHAIQRRGLINVRIPDKTSTEVDSTSAIRIARLIDFSDCATFHSA